MTVRANKPAFNIREKLKELTHSIGLKGRELMSADTAQEARDLVSAGRKNLVINGDYSVWQRGTGPSTISSSSAFLADRWDVATAGTAQLTQEQSTDSPPGFSYSLKVSPSVADTLTSAEQSWITYKIEAQDMTFLDWGSSDAIPITISFWAKSSDSSNRCLWIYAQDAGDHIARQFNNSAPNTWEKFTFTIPPNSLGVVNNDNGIGIYVRFVLDAGATAANGTLPSQWTSLTSDSRYGTMGGFLSNTANEFYITGVQVEPGKNATDFEHRSYGEELALCQRYYFELVNIGGADSGYIGPGHWWGTDQIYVTIPFPVEMRTVPTYNGVAAGTGPGYAIFYSGGTTGYLNASTGRSGIQRLNKTSALTYWQYWKSSSDGTGSTVTRTAGQSGWLERRSGLLRINFSAEL